MNPAVHEKGERKESQTGEDRMEIRWLHDHSRGDQLFGVSLIENHFITKATLHADDLFSLGIHLLRDELEVLKYVPGRITLPS